MRKTTFHFCFFLSFNFDSQKKNKVEIKESEERKRQRIKRTKIGRHINGTIDMNGNQILCLRALLRACVCDWLRCREKTLSHCLCAHTRQIRTIAMNRTMRCEIKWWKHDDSMRILTSNKHLADAQLFSLYQAHAFFLRVFSCFFSISHLKLSLFHSKVFFLFSENSHFVLHSISSSATFNIFFF